MKIIGFKKVTFDFDDGNSVSGFMVFTSSEEKGITGVSCDHFFISEKKATACGFVPVLNKEVEVYYNKYKKVIKVDAA